MLSHYFASYLEFTSLSPTAESSQEQDVSRTKTVLSRNQNCSRLVVALIWYFSQDGSLEEAVYVSKLREVRAKCHSLASCVGTVCIMRCTSVDTVVDARLQRLGNVLCTGLEVHEAIYVK